MNLLVVEDEESSRESMVSILRRHYPDMGVHSAANGEEALSKAELVHYSVILSDIQMPLMDGLTLLEKLKDFAPDIPVIMISAYDYFYYAQRALQLGAFDYILKPFDEERILSVIDRALTLEHKAAAISSSPPGLEINLARKTAAPYLKEARWGRVSLLKEDPGPNQLPRSAAEWDQLAAYIYGKLKAFSDHQFWVFAKQDHTGLIVLETIQEKDQDQLETDWDALEQFTHALQQERRPRLYLSLGTLDAMDSISLSQVHAEESSHFCFYDWKAPILWFPTITSVFENTPVFMALGKLVRSGRREEIFNQVHKAVESALSSHVMPRIFKEAMDRWIGELIQDNRGFIMAVDGIRLGEMRSQALAQEHSDTFNECFTQLLLELSRLIGNFNSNKNAVLLEKCIEYIEKNYANPDLSLQSITEHFFFNSSYFSTIFKKQTGKTIMQYLTMVRINHSKELLRNTDIRINEVAGKVGFSDMRYFMRVFKAEVGMTPGTYRKRESEGLWH